MADVDSDSTPPMFHGQAHGVSSLAAPIFVDCTASVIGKDERVRESLRLGTQYWVERTDRVLGVDVLGHTGLCAGDVNNDGLDDLYVPQLGGLPNLLLVQNADGTVTDRAKEAGVDLLDLTRACLLVDMDNDGDQDLVLSIRNATVIYENDGTGKFGGAEHKPALSARTGTPSEFYSIAAADYDRNEFVDLYSVRYVKATYGVSIPVPYHDANNGPPNHLLSNRGGWKFDDVTDRVGLNQNNARFSLAASWEDFDDDGDQDLYVANDFGQANLYVNTDGRFSDEAAARGAKNQAAGMGVSWADYNLDGRMDLVVSNMYSHAGARVMRGGEFRASDPPEVRAAFLHHAMGNALFRGAEGGRFEDVSSKLRVESGGWSWGAMFVDINNDGWEDLLVPNGNLTGANVKDIDGLFWRRVASESPLTATVSAKYEDGWAALSLLMNEGYSWAGRQRNATYLNFGGSTFSDVSEGSGFGFLDDARAIAVTDWDQDGDLDVWVKNRTAPLLRFLRNETRREANKETVGAGSNGTSASSPMPNYVSLCVRGTRCNRQAIGARVTVHSGGRAHARTVRAGEGYLAQSSHRLVFGLGASDTIERVTVRWPGGATEVFDGVAINRAYQLTEGNGPSVELIVRRNPSEIRIEPGAIEPATASGEVRRIVLSDRLAMPGFSLTSNTGSSLNTETKLGRACLWYFWSARSPRSVRGLARLAEAIPKLRAADIEVIPISVDMGEFAAGATEAARRIDPDMPMIAASAALIDFLDIMQQELLGHPEDLELPSLLTVDRLGLLSAVHRGGLEVDAVIEDCKRDPKQRFPFAGRTLFPAARNYGFLVQQFRQRNQVEMAEFYRELAMRAQEGRP